MRNLTKILASVVALSIILGVAAFAKSYPDVNSNADYAEAVNVISDLGIAKGDENGDFNAEKTLTRAEGAAFVLRLLGLEEAAKAAAGTATDFSDVPPEHWAAGYVSVAAANGIVSGMGKGTFAPNGELTYAQIIRMLISALGYESLASELGEWPNNYMSAASKIRLTAGITGNANDAVTRGTTARLIYAALVIIKTGKTDADASEGSDNETGIPESIDFDSKIFTVSKVSRTAVDDDAYTLLTGYQNGEEVQYLASSDKDITKLYGIKLNGAAIAKGAEIDVNDIKKGDMLYVTAGSDGIIAAGVVYNNVLNPKGVTAKTVDIITGGSIKGGFVMGYVLGANNSTVFLGTEKNLQFDANNPGSSYSFTTDNSTLVTVYNSDKKMPLYKGTSADIDKNTFVFARLDVSGKAIETLVFVNSSKIQIENDEIETEITDDTAPESGVNEVNVSSSIDFDGKMFTVSKVSKTTIDDDDYTLLTGYRSGEEVQYLASDDKDITKFYEIDLTGASVKKGAPFALKNGKNYNIKKGDIFFITASRNNIISAAVRYNNVINPAHVNAAAADIVTDGNNKGSLAAGYVLGVKNTEVFLGAAENPKFDSSNPGSAYSFTVSDSTLVTLYDSSKKNPLSEGTLSDIAVKGAILFVRLDDSGKAIEALVIVDSSDIIIKNDETETEITDNTATENGNSESSTSAKIGFKSNMFIVSKVSKTAVNDYDYTLLTGYRDGEEVQYLVSDDKDFTKLYEIDLNGQYVTEGASLNVRSIVKGDILFVTVGSDSIIAKAVRYNNANEENVKAKVSNAVTKGNDAGGFVEGYVLGVKNNKVYIGKHADPNFDINTPGGAFYFTASENTFVTVYDGSKKSPLEEGSIADLDEGNVVFVRLNRDIKAMEVVVSVK